MKRLKWSSENVVNGIWGEEPDEENDIACVRVADFDRPRLAVRMENPTIRAVGPAQRAGRELRPGDLLIEKSGGGDKQIVGAVMYYSHCTPAVSSNFVGRITTTKGNDPRFWVYVHAMLYAGKLTYPAIKQTTGIQNLDISAYFNTMVVFPPLSEQHGIAAFLDREMSSIDRMILNLDLIIKHLSEYRNAVITKTVVEGSPADANVHESHTNYDVIDTDSQKESIKLKYVVSINDDALSENEDPLREISYIDIGSIDQSTGDISPKEMLFSDAPTRARRLVQDGDTIVSTVGTYPRDVVFMRNPSPKTVVSTGFAVIRSHSIDPDYCYWAMQEQEFMEKMIVESNGVIYPAINASQIKDLIINVPSINDQKLIAQYLDTRINKITKAITKGSLLIEYLNEYKNSLIHNAVTGKIDVRPRTEQQES